MVKKQIIKLKKRDIDQALVRSLKKAAFEAGRGNLTKERVHANLKLRKPRYRPDLTAEINN